jgi:hypothetical protein
MGTAIHLAISENGFHVFIQNKPTNTDQTLKKHKITTQENRQNTQPVVNTTG